MPCRNDGPEGDGDVSADDAGDADDVADADDAGGDGDVLADGRSGLLPPEMNVAIDCTWPLRWT